MANSPLSAVAIALYNALYPLKQAVTTDTGLLLLLADLGWRPNLDEALGLLFDATGVSDAYADFAGIANAITNALDGAEITVTRLLNNEEVDPNEVIDLINEFRSIINQLQNVRLTGPNAISLPPGLDVQPLWDSLSEELPDYLLTRYVALHQPQLWSLMMTLGLAQVVRVTPQGEPFRVPYTRRVIRWDYFSDFLNDPIQHLREVFRWAGARKADDPETALAGMRILTALQGLFRKVGVPAHLEPMTDTLTNRFLASPPPPRATRPSQLTVPMFRLMQGGTSAQLALEFAAVPETPVAMPNDPISDPTTPPVPMPVADSVLLTHRTMGSVQQSLQLTENIILSFNGNVDASHQLNLLLTPTGPELRADPGLDFALDIDLLTTNTEPWLLAGAADGTRLTLGGTSGGVALSGETGGPADVSFDLGFTELEVALEGGQGDGLLNSLLGTAQLAATFDVSVTYSTGGGLKFAGSGGIEAIIPIDKTIGPVWLGDLELAFGPAEEGLRLTALLSGEMTIGPLFASVERIGVYVQADEANGGDGMIGPFDIGVGFQPPSGYSVALDADPITGGGYVSVLDHEYRGALALSFDKIGFSAFAILTTQFPDGDDGYSFAASVFAEFSVPLAYGFFLTGLGGFIGVNRTLDSDAMRDVLYEGRLDDLLFPADPIQSAPQILDDMAAILPPQQGQHVIGPCARISWGQPNLINITLGVMLEIGGEARLVILGGLGMILPDKDKVLVALNLSFMGEIDFAAGTISFDATLQGSRVLTFAIDGDVAIRTGWANGIEHIASFGGLHPDYPKPANLPDLARLSISFGGNNPRLTLSAYFSTTMNSLQFGARADMYARGPKIKFVGQVAAEGFVAFDALIYFNPFAFQVGLRGGISLLVDGDVKAGLFFSLELSGPNTYVISGEVWVKVFGIKVRFAITHTWGQRESLPTYTANGAALLREALETAPGFEPEGGNDRDLAVSFRGDEDCAGTIDPLGRLRLTQSIAPLGVALEKIGEADLTGPDTLDLYVTQGGATLPAIPVNGEFVRGHFFRLTKAERLRSPAIETHKSGLSIGAATALAGAGAAIEDSYEYEVIVIPMHTSDGPAILRSGTRVFTGDIVLRFTASAQALKTAPRAGAGAAASAIVTDRVTMAPLEFGATDTVGTLHRDVSAGNLTNVRQSAINLDLDDASPVASYISEAA